MLSSIASALLSFASPQSALIVGILKQVNWKIALPVIALVAALGFAYYKGYSEAEQVSRAAQLTEQLKEAKAQLIRINNARVDAEKKALDIEATNLELEHKVSVYVASIEKTSKKDGACRLSHADLNGLRSLTKRDY
jgi:Tfp pilus assembly major pilin PilA